jgi:hypothetical protein
LGESAEEWKSTMSGMKTNRGVGKNKPTAMMLATRPTVMLA